jgi:hypothetical protein
MSDILTSYSTSWRPMISPRRRMRSFVAAGLAFLALAVSRLPSAEREKTLQAI